MKFFLTSDDTYLGKVLKANFTEAEHEIADTIVESAPAEAAEGEEGEEAAEPAPAATGSINLWEDAEALKSLIVECDVIILDLIRNAEKSTTVLGILKDLELEEAKTVIGVSSIMSWCKTDSKKGPLRESAYKTRKTLPKYKGLKMMESMVLSAKRENLNAYVIASGILYGGGEEDFATLFRHAWMCEKEALTVIGEGANIIPTLHINDLSNVLLKLSSAPPPNDEKSYMVITDGTNTTQKQLIETISTGLGTGKIDSIAEDDESLLLESTLPVDIMLTNLTFEKEGSYQTLLEMEMTAGIGAVFPKCRDDFIASRKLKPVRIAVVGMPGAGKTYYASKLAAALYVPHVTIGDIIKEAVAVGDETSTEIQSLLEEAAEYVGDGKKKPKAKKGKGKGPSPDPRPRINTAMLTTLVKKKLNSAACKNKGFVLDGYPRTKEEAEALFKKPLAEGEEAPEPQEDEDGNPIPVPITYDGEYMVDSLIVLDVTQEKAQSRMMAIADDEVEIGHNDEEGFLRRWERFEGHAETPEENMLPFFSQMEVLDVPMETTESKDDCLNAMTLYVQKNGVAYNFHPTEEEIAVKKKEAETAAATAAALAAAEAEKKKQEELAERENWKAANERRKNLVLTEDQELVEQCSLPLRKYLMANIIPKLVDGLVDVCKTAPEDPVDHLAEYLFKTSVGGPAE